MSVFRNLMMRRASGNGYIKFADPAVEKICAENWGDGTGITYAQAARVTTLDNKFKGNTEITSFDELQYFHSLTRLNGSAFQYCTNLQSIIIPESVITIGQHALEGCTLLTGQLCLENVLTIEDSGLKLTGYSTVNFPNATKLDDAAFARMANLTNAFIPKVASIPNYLFLNCTNLLSVDFDKANCMAINQQAFNNCANLKIEIDFPNVTSIGAQAFYRCANAYGSVNLPKLNFLGETAFARSKISKITNLGSIKTSGHYSFGACAELTEAHFPATVKTIDIGFMYQCTALKVLVMNSESLSQIDTNEMFDKLPSDCKIYVPDASVDTYKGYDGFKKVAGQIFPLSEYVPE